MKKVMVLTVRITIIALVILGLTACSKHSSTQGSTTNVPANQNQNTAAGEEVTKELQENLVYLISEKYGFYLEAPMFWSGRVVISEENDSFTVKHRTTSKNVSAKNPVILNVINYGSEKKWEQDANKKDEPFPYEKLGVINGNVFAGMPSFDFPYDDKSPTDKKEYTEIISSLDVVLKSFKPINNESEDKKFYGIWKIQRLLAASGDADTEIARQLIGKKLYYTDVFAYMEGNIADRNYYREKTISVQEFTEQYNIPFAQTDIPENQATMVTVFDDANYEQISKEIGNMFLVKDKNTLIMILDGALLELTREGIKTDSPTQHLTEKDNSEKTGEQARNEEDTAEQTMTKGVNRYAAAGINDPVGFEQYFYAVQSLINSDDREEVVKYFSYPVTLQIHNQQVTIKNAEEMLKQYDTVFTLNVKKAVAEQKVDNLFVNYMGVMVGNGQLWFGVGEGEKYFILSVNP
ncbi:hypothetical protein SAMN05660649_00828 [Desulfotomaculum arcticum]|uniref:Uncharacterized protein n=1 Tax=Desulfotruncus arcticus DSM 17038 TaxID=1121424 RepID=A0A1I2PJY0_9FIRM|nr:hypothetical protein [Desulfotruncus arcticus]SFG13721.1 hypothetical protein SAMN05660649_00828 [Desulfotomaculum arcticum] [Desulfotruncus arcticus DSM 17038]